MVNKSLYETYHQKLKIHRKVITLDNFTYGNILKNIYKYIPSSGTVLDVGSATGTISLYLGSKGLHVDGVELSTNAFNSANLNKQKFHLDNVNFIRSSINEYKTNKKYNLILCLDVIEHLENDSGCLKKISKYMYKKSILVVSVPSTSAPLYRLGLLRKFDEKVGHLRRYSTDDIKKLLHNTNYDIIKISKVEGLLRNILFTNNMFGALIKFTKLGVISRIITYIDNVTLKLFGESQLILICKKR